MRVLTSIIGFCVLSLTTNSTAHAAATTSLRLYSGVHDNVEISEFSLTGVDRSLQRTFSNPIGDLSTYNGVGRVSADQISVKAYGSVELSNYVAGSYTSRENCPEGITQCAPDGGPTTIAASLNATQTDSLTISGGTGIGYYQFEFEITGSGSFDTDLPLGGSRGAQASGSISFNDTTNKNFDVFGFSDAGVFTTDVFAFNYGESFDLTLRSAFEISLDDFVSSALPENSVYNFSGVADFENTILLKSISIFEDAAGQTLARSVSVGSLSGTEYNVVFDEVSEVPLPAAAPLFIAGIAGAGFIRRLAHRA